MTAYKTDYEPATGRIDCLPIPATRNQGWPGVYAVLYTDEVNGEQTCRDDLWIATTGAIKAAIERAQYDAYAEGRKDEREALASALSMAMDESGLAPGWPRTHLRSRVLHHLGQVAQTPGDSTVNPARPEGPLPSSTAGVQRYRCKRPDESDRDYRIAMGWDAEPTVALSFHPFPQVQPSGGKELLLITTSKVFWKGSLYDGKQWRTDSDGWSATQGKHMHVLNNLSDVIYWTELPDAVVLVNNVLSAKGPEARSGAQPMSDSGASGSPASKVTRPDDTEQGGSSIGLGAEGEQ